MPPQGRWRVWAFLGGRGAGKTGAGAEWVHGILHGRERNTTDDGWHDTLLMSYCSWW